MYYNTPIVRVRDDEIELNTGGWYTYSTKARMNQISEEFGLGYRVYSYRGTWFVNYKGKDIELVDSVILVR